MLYPKEINVLFENIETKSIKIARGRKKVILFSASPWWVSYMYFIAKMLSQIRDRNLLLAEVRDCTISGPRNPVVVCFTSLLSSLTAISSPPLSCFHSPTRNLP